MPVQDMRLLISKLESSMVGQLLETATIVEKLEHGTHLRACKQTSGNSQREEIADPCHATQQSCLQH